MKTIFKTCLGCFVFLILILIIGFIFRKQIIPQAINIIGINKPKDLGITYTESDLRNMDNELGLQVEKVTIDETSSIPESLSFEGSTDVDASFTNAEVTAQINRASDYWKYTPFKEMQVKVNPDGTAEASGILDITRLNGFISYFGYSNEDLNKGLEYINAGNLSELPIYMKGTGNITENQATLDLTTIKVYGFNLPADVTTQAEQGLEAISERVIEQAGEVNISKLEITDGETHLKGTIPERIKSIGD